MWRTSEREKESCKSYTVFNIEFVSTVLLCIIALRYLLCVNVSLWSELSCSCSIRADRKIHTQLNGKNHNRGEPIHLCGISALNIDFAAWELTVQRGNCTESPPVYFILQQYSCHGIHHQPLPHGYGGNETIRSFRLSCTICRAKAARLCHAKVCC